jgi:extracellular factor (EF) 3-hydroxypalmitic acid methyl ester biosynthesis protein
VLVKGIEVNTHIAVKPYGYAGDFQMMNYIYDYCNQDKWLGSNAYEKVINRYSTNLSICQGNIFRKEFIKNEIKKEIQRKPNAKILSIGCGPAREITEMIDEGVLNNEAKYVFFDFEKQAIDFVKQLLKAKEHRIELKAEFVLSDIRDFILKGMPSTLNECDLIYISGVFDYLKDQTCQRVMHNIVKLLVPGGRAIICNMSDEYAEDRAYYELLGDWFMYHRTAKKMYELVPANIGKIASRVDFVPGTKKYHCLTLVKE